MLAKVSVIIPIYNSEKYLRKCLDSVCTQSLKDIEIVCVNDGSTDSSKSIIEEYSANDSRIVVVDKPNGGLVSARKAGIAVAKGKYIGYVDSDDWIEPQMYESLYELAEETQADLVTSGYWLEGNYISKCVDNIDSGVYEGESLAGFRDRIFFDTNNCEVGIRASLCCKLFLKEKFINAQNAIPNDISMSEDKACLLTYSLDCQRIVVTDAAYYHYIMYNTSMSHIGDDKYLDKVSRVYGYMKTLYVHPNFSDSMRQQLELYIVEMLYKGINSRLGFENKNLLWIDPYWMSKIAGHARLVLFGGGELITAYKNQLESNDGLEYIATLERFDANSSIDKENAKAFLDQLAYDYILITTKNKEKAVEERNALVLLGIDDQRILWFEQTELFWKFAKANGWFR